LDAEGSVVRELGPESAELLPSPELESEPPADEEAELAVVEYVSIHDVTQSDGVGSVISLLDTSSAP
jgi:hypothetical protein